MIEDILDGLKAQLDDICKRLSPKVRWPHIYGPQGSQDRFSEEILPIGIDAYTPMNLPKEHCVLILSRRFRPVVGSEFLGDLPSLRSNDTRVSDDRIAQPRACESPEPVSLGERRNDD